MAGSIIGAQTYTIRDHMRTPAEMAKSFRRLRRMGYEAVQVSVSPEMPTEDLAKILNDEGLHCAATHVGLDQLKDTDWCVAHHQALNCQYTAIGGHSSSTGIDGWKQFVEQFNTVGQALAQRGLRVGYHNHSHELAPLQGPPAGGDATILAMLIRELDASIWFELDTYWIAHGGGDPIAWIDRIAASGPGRLPCIHFKDMAISAKREQQMCEIGVGNLNWPGILKACKNADVAWYLVERDDGELDPFDSLEQSLKNMHAMGLP